MDADDFYRHGIWWITRCLAQGGFPEERQCEILLRGGVTHLFNVSTSPYPASLVRLGFRGLMWRPVEDLKRIPDGVALECLDTLHAVLREPDAKVYLHCVAGQNRSPSVLWLYLVACGMEPQEAENLIGRRSLDGVPRHPNLVDDALAAKVRAHGGAHYLPLSRPEILEAYGA
jgi:hypothetical protein